MDHQHTRTETNTAPSGFRLSWPGHQPSPARQTHRPGRLLHLLPLGLAAFATRHGCTGWPVRLSAPGLEPS